MADDLRLLLVRLIDPDNNQRKQAEAQLEEFVGRQGFFLAIVGLFEQNRLTEREAHVAAALLKNTGLSRMPATDHVNVLEGIMRVLLHADATSGLQGAVLALLASCAAKLMRVVLHSSSKSSATLQECLHCMLSSATSVAHNGLRCCRELMVEWEGQPEILAALLDPLLPLVVRHALNPLLEVGIRCHAMHIVAEFGEQCSATSFDAPLQAFLDVGCGRLSHDGGASNVLVVEAMRVVVCHMQQKRIAASTLESPEFFMAVLQAIEVDIDVLCEATDDVDDDTFHHMNRAMALRWETVVVVLRRRRDAKAVVTLFRGMLEPLCRLMLESSRLPLRTAAGWASDVNLFLHQESERRDEISWCCRDVAVDCVDLCSARFASRWLSVVFRVIAEVLLENAAPNSDAWRTREAALFILQTAVSRIPMHSLEEAGGEMGAIIGVLISVDLSPSSPLLLAARALAVVQDVVKRVTKDRRSVLCDQFLVPCLRTLESSLSHSRMTVVTGAAVSLLDVIARHCSPEIWTASVVDSGLGALLQAALSPALVDEGLYLFLETLLSWVRKSLKLSVVSPTFEHVPAALLDCWRMHIRDPNASELVQAVVSLLVAAPACDGGFRDVWLPWMGDVLAGKGSAEALCVIPLVVLVLKDVMERGSSSLCECAAAALVQPLCQLLLSNDDSSIASTSCECLGALLRRAGSSLDAMRVAVTPLLCLENLKLGGLEVSQPTWSRSRTPPLQSLGSSTTNDPRLSPMAPLDEPLQMLPLSDVLIAIAATLLRPDRGEVSLMNVGVYLGAVASRAHMFSEEQMQLFLTALLKRYTAELHTSSAIAELTLPLAILLRDFRDPFLFVTQQRGWTLPMFELWLQNQVKYVRAGLPDMTRLGVSVEALVATLECWPATVDPAAPIMWRGETSTRGVPVALSVAMFASLCLILCEALTRPHEFAAGASELCAKDGTDSSDEESVESGDDDGDGSNDDDGLKFASPPATQPSSNGNLPQRLPATLPPQLSPLLRLVPLAQQYGGAAWELFPAPSQSTLYQFLNYQR